MKKKCYKCGKVGDFKNGKDEERTDPIECHECLEKKVDFVHGIFNADPNISLSLESSWPLLKKKPEHILEFDSVDNLKLPGKDFDAIIFMKTKKDASKLGWEISEMFSKDSLVVWASEESDEEEFIIHLFKHEKEQKRKIVWRNPEYEK